MTNTADRISSSSNTPKDSPETVETFADVLKLLEIESLDVDQWVKDHAVESSKRLIKRYGKEWMTQNRVRLIEELEYLNVF